MTEDVDIYICVCVCVRERERERERGRGPMDEKGKPEQGGDKGYFE
jgi:hypothetical protein